MTVCREREGTCSVSTGGWSLAPTLSRSLQWVWAEEPGTTLCSITRVHLVIKEYDLNCTRLIIHVTNTQGLL